jgi:8-oxo-dGTP diphosphatase
MEINSDNELLNITYGGTLRLRVCGVCQFGDKYLLANHTGLNPEGDFWCPPGGGVEFGETIEEALKREFLEEANLQIEKVEFLSVYEFIQKPLHAVELFYSVKIVAGDLKTGKDPEMYRQILKEVKWLAINEIKLLKKTEIHQYFHQYLK